MRAGSIEIAASQLQSLAASSAMQLAVQQKRFVEVLQRRPIVDQRLVHLVDFGAELHATVTGEFDNDYEKNRRKQSSAAA